MLINTRVNVTRAVCTRYLSGTAAAAARSFRVSFAVGTKPALVVSVFPCFRVSVSPCLRVSLSDQAHVGSVSARNYPMCTYVHMRCRCVPLNPVHALCCTIKILILIPAPHTPGTAVYCGTMGDTAVGTVHMLRSCKRRVLAADRQILII